MKLLALAIIVAAAAPAHAQSASGQADLLFKQGRDLMAAGKLAEACAAFEASNQLEPAVSTLLNLGACREKNGQLATAYGAYVNAERLARTATDAASRELDAVAAEHERRIEPRLSKLTIFVPDAVRIAGLEIRRGGDIVDPAMFGQPLAVDGGTYELTAHAPDHVDWKKTVTITTEKADVQITVPPLARIGDVTAPPPLPPSPPPPSSPGHTLPIVLGVVAVASLGGAVGFELWGESTYNKSKVEPNYGKQDDLYNSANYERYTAEALAVAGVGLGAAAVWLYFRGGDTAPVASAQAGGASIGIAGTF